ncbi:ABC transporter permease [Nocardioides aequoreus]|uniref:ABC transporter permease n=1 Tax=Nocardioides aequoreus TaxID=397278 RepID=UPI0004C38D08|nr:ABC transporter permease [Nocardioides aequoreus]
MSVVRRGALALASPVLALLLAGLIITVVLAVIGDDIAGFWSVMSSVPEPRNAVAMLNQASVLYLSGVAAAIGFRMNLFNIGVEGQYRLAAFAAGAVAGAAWLPGYLNSLLAVVVAMAVGAAWAGLAGALRAYRGVSEVISTIMLNSIAGFLISYLIVKVGRTTGNATGTDPMPEGSRIGTIAIFPDSPTELYGLSLLAIVVGVLFWLVLNRTRFGFELRATGASDSAAVASGVDSRRMIVTTMLLSGAVAGLVGLPVIFSSAYNYGSSFQAGLGFAGIAVALLGRNHPVGIAFAALLFAYLSQQANLLNILAGISPDIVAVAQGVVVMSVVIVYEVVRRYRVRAEQTQVASTLSAESRAAAPTEGAAS